MSPGSAEDVPEFNLPLKYPGEIAGVLAGFYSVFVVLHYCQPPGGRGLLAEILPLICVGRLAGL